VELHSRHCPTLARGWNAAHSFDRAVEHAEALPFGIEGKEFIALPDNTAGALLSVGDAERIWRVWVRQPPLAAGIQL
jgi:hypothetical protein